MKKFFIVALLVATATVGGKAYADSNVYRLYNHNTGEHFYTTSLVERNADVTAGWTYEGIGWVAPSSSATPIYRVYNPNAKGGDHYYTKSKFEAQSLVNLGWRWDNAAQPVFYSGGKIPTYVAYNPNAQSGAHNYTVNKAEQDNLLHLGWKYGAVAWYAVGQGKAVPTPTVAPKHVDVNVTGVGGSQQNVAGSYRLLYSNKPFDSGSLTGNAMVDFSADVALTGMSSDYETQFVIAGNGGTGSGQIGVELHYQAGSDANFAQGRINVTSINFPSGAGTSGQQYYSTNTSAPRIANGQSVHLQVKYLASGYMQTFVNGVLVGQYKTKLTPGNNNIFILHDNTNATVQIRNLKVLKNGMNVTDKGVPSFSSTSFNFSKGAVSGAY